MIAEMQPLYWRIQDTDNSGLDAVSLLMPANEGEPATVVPTDVSFCSRRSGNQAVDVRWSDDDSDLFLSLLERVSSEDAEDDSIVLDINDGIVQGIVQLVALTRFKTPWPTDELVGDDINTERDETEIGDLVALNTRYGFVMGIVVGMDSIDMTCILLEDISDGDVCLVPDHSVLVFDRTNVLPIAFADTDTGEGATFH
ncbi:hypothetical protein [Thalassolituus sp.]|uniref:hypothetical protein n=1 Tax=Thalassolituus sp. TaxID=2030822 RepID=UPI00351511FE